MSEITLTSNEGKPFGAYFAQAAQKDAPGIVLIQEIFGVNPAMRKLADHWAGLGYNVLVPDLFWRKESGLQLNDAIPADFTRGVELMESMDEGLTTGDLEVARQWLAQHIGHDRIAGMGFCWGGRLVVRMAAEAGVRCAVSYYGVELESLLPNLPDTTAPVLLHIAELDSYVPAPIRERILDNAKTREGWEAFVYDGCDHAFARPGGAHFNEAATALAEERSIAFMNKYLQAS